MNIINSGIDNGLYLFFNFQNYKCIDLLYLYHNNNEINNININDYIFNSSYDLLYNTFYNLKYINIDFNEIIKIHIMLFKKFNTNTNKIINTNIKLINNTINNYLNSNKKLIIRTGIVELKACFCKQDQLLYDCIADICNNIENFEYIKNILNLPLKCWITHYDEYNYYMVSIVKLMINAGFYINNNYENALNNFLFFKNEYINCMKNADYIIEWNFLNCYSLNILNDLKKEKSINHIKFPDENNLCYLFNNKKILLLSPFKELIEKQYNTGNIYKLKKNNNLNNISLTIIESFLTTYPNKSHNNFIETYNYYIEEIDKQFLNQNFDIFTCSCGCYGILLCNYVYTKYNITSIYLGHCINELFGIKCNRSGNILNIDNENLYLESDLNLRYLNIENIENNCYGYTNK